MVLTLVLVYSKSMIKCDLEGPPCGRCREYDRECVPTTRSPCQLDVDAAPVQGNLT